MKWKTTLGVLLVVAIGIAYAQVDPGPPSPEQVQEALNMAEAKARIEIYRVVEEDIRLRVSIMENRIKYAQLQNAIQNAAVPQKEVQPIEVKPPIPPAPSAEAEENIVNE